MAADPAALAEQLPPWLQWSANAALFLVALLGSVFAIKTGLKSEAAKPADPFEVEELLESSPIKSLIEAVETVAEQAVAQTEALVGIAATLKADADERRFQREVGLQVALDRAAGRDVPAPPRRRRRAAVPANSA